MYRGLSVAVLAFQDQRAGGVNGGHCIPPGDGLGWSAKGAMTEVPNAPRDCKGLDT